MYGMYEGNNAFYTELDGSTYGDHINDIITITYFCGILINSIYQTITVITYKTLSNLLIKKIIPQSLYKRILYKRILKPPKGPFDSDSAIYKNPYRERVNIRRVKKLT